MGNPVAAPVYAIAMHLGYGLGYWADWVRAFAPQSTVPSFSGDRCGSIR
jgi:hypothetical protein